MDDSTCLPTLPDSLNPPDTAPPPKLPGATLTQPQRDCCWADMAGGTLKTLAEQFQVTDRTISNWRALPDYHHYADCVVNEMVRAGIRKARAIAANVLPDIASNAAALALGKGRNGKPKHPYQDKFSKLIMEAAGLHAQSTELAAEIPTDSGPVRLIFRSKAGWSDVQVQTDS